MLKCTKTLASISTNEEKPIYGKYAFELMS